MIDETAYHYLGHQPDIGKDNSSEHYKLIGQKMVQKYPSIQRQGTHPWVSINLAVLQKYSPKMNF